jgi:hypothetical protein
VNAGRGVAAADVDHVLLEHECLEVADRPGEQLQVGRPAVERRERPIEASHVPLGIAARGRQKAHAGMGRARERQHERVEQRIFGLHRESAATHRDDPPAHGQIDLATS